MLPPARVLLPSRFVIGCAGLWQLCDAVRAVWCRSRFVLLAQQANSSHAPGAPTRTMVERRRAYPTCPRELAWTLGARTNDVIFIILWKLAVAKMAAQTRCHFAVAAASMRKVHAT